MIEAVVLTKYIKITGNQTFSIGDIYYGWTPPQYFAYFNN